jgi:hypothetical protein
MVYFPNKKAKFGQFLEGLAMKKVGIFFSHLKYITGIWYILMPFGNLLAIWYIFACLGILYKEKSGNPATIGFFSNWCRFMSHDTISLFV